MTQVGAGRPVRLAAGRAASRAAYQHQEQEHRDTPVSVPEEGPGDAQPPGDGRGVRIKPGRGVAVPGQSAEQFQARVVHRVVSDRRPQPHHGQRGQGNPCEATTSLPGRDSEPDHAGDQGGHDRVPAELPGRRRSQQRAFRAHRARDRRQPELDVPQRQDGVGCHAEQGTEAHVAGRQRGASDRLLHGEKRRTGRQAEQEPVDGGEPGGPPWREQDQDRDGNEFAGLFDDAGDGDLGAGLRDGEQIELCDLARHDRGDQADADRPRNAQREEAQEPRPGQRLGPREGEPRDHDPQTAEVGAHPQAQFGKEQPQPEQPEQRAGQHDGPGNRPHPGGTRVRAEPAGAPYGQVLPPFPRCGTRARDRRRDRRMPERCRGHPQPPTPATRANRTVGKGMGARKPA